MRRLAFAASISLVAACTPALAPRAAATPAPAVAPLPAPALQRPAVVLVEERAAAGAPIVTPESVGLAREPLERLVVEAERTDSDALLVLAGDRVVVARSFGHDDAPLETMSVTKGFVGIAIGMLIDEGKIASLDVPLSTFFPEWKEGRKAKVVLRHVLNHTSGLAHLPAAGVLTKQKDHVAYARALAIETEPGEQFSYNNEAVALLSGVVRAAAGEPLDVYLKRKLFTPLGIVDVGWAHDAAGNATAFYGLALRARDLAKVGACLRDGGIANGKTVIPASWLAAMRDAPKKMPWIGALTWLHRDGPWQVQSKERRAQLADEGFSAADALAPLDGKRFVSRAAYWMEAGALLSPGDRATLGRLVRDDLLPFGQVDGPLVGFDFNGWLGQYLVVYPAAGIVAVRQRREPPNVRDEDNKKIGMRGFVELVRAALPASIPAWP